MIGNPCFQDIREILKMKVKPGTEQHLLRELKKDSDVAAVFISLGMYDIIVLLTINDLAELNCFISEKVKNMRGVVGTHVAFVKKEENPTTHLSGELYQSSVIH